MTHPNTEAKQRDDYTCQKCGYRNERTTRLEAHHIVPQSQGGTDDLDNLLTLCSRCHDFAPDHDFIDDYESVVEIYTNTGRKPERDLVYFGARLIDSTHKAMGDDVDDILATLDQTLDARHETDIHTPKCLIWMVNAMPFHARIRHEMEDVLTSPDF